MWFIIFLTLAVTGASGAAVNCTDNGYCDLTQCNSNDLLEYMVMNKRCPLSCNSCGGINEQCGAAPTKYCTDHANRCTAIDGSTEFFMLELCTVTCNRCGCVDDIPDDFCITQFQRCNIPEEAEAMTHMCPRTCQRCPQTTTVVPPTTTTVYVPLTTSAGCVDRAPGYYCETHAALCNQANFTITMKDFCPKTCQQCPGVTTATSAGPAGPCYDKDPSCLNKTELCGLQFFHEVMSDICAKTCQFCQAPCEDVDPECPTIQQLCTDIYFEPLMSTVCRMTCNLCQEPPCVDEDPNCSSVAKLCNNSNFHDSMYKKCRKTCNLCKGPVPTSPVPTVPTPPPTTTTPCTDLDPDCVGSETLCGDPNFYNETIIYCRKSCGYCY